MAHGRHIHALRHVLHHSVEILVVKTLHGVAVPHHTLRHLAHDGHVMGLNCFLDHTTQIACHILKRCIGGDVTRHTQGVPTHGHVVRTVQHTIKYHARHCSRINAVEHAAHHTTQHGLVNALHNLGVVHHVSHHVPHAISINTGHHASRHVQHGATVHSLHDVAACRHVPHPTLQRTLVTAPHRAHHHIPHVVV